MKTLTLDLGTHVGWALLEGTQIIASGTLHLATDDELESQRRAGKERTLDVRFIRLHTFVMEHVARGIDRIVFEDVTFSGSPMQNQVWAGLRSAIWAAAMTSSVAIFCVPVTTLKVFATNKTRADKSDMAHALVSAEAETYRINGNMTVVRRDGTVADDNEVDAIWLARYTMAVDRGERDFLTAYQRKVIKREKRRANRRAVKAARKAKKALKLAQSRAKKKLLAEAVKATGRCCGVLRQPAPRNFAMCPKCGRKVKVHPVALLVNTSTTTSINPEPTVPVAA